MKHLVFMYRDLEMGGIQNILYNLSKNLLMKHDIDITWIHPEKVSISNSFSDIFNRDNISFVSSKIITQDTNIGDIIRYDINDQIVMIAFEPIDFNYLQLIKKNSFNCIINTFLIMPHFTNNELFLENHFINPIVKKKTYNTMKYMYHYWYNTNQLLFCNKRHYETLQSVYNINFVNPEQYLLKSVIKINNFNEILVKERFNNRKYFNIISVSRFEFPHKGYVLGLIDDFEKFSSKHKDARLKIVGSGPGEHLLNKRIEKLSSEVKDKINLVGELSPIELEKYLKNMDINIGVAGSITTGISNSVLSIPVRHYSYNCECYGYFHNEKSQLINDAPGIDVLGYIEEVYAMDYNKYKDVCTKDFEKLISMKEFNPDYIFEINNNDYESIRNYDFLKIEKINEKVGVVIKVKSYVKRILKRLNMHLNKGDVITKDGYKK